MKKSAVHFGSGSIGRGFIGKLLHDSGYQVTMLDVDDSIISSINAIGGYDLYLINHNYQKVFIDQVSAINSLKDTQGAIDAIKDADIITTAVLATNLEKIAPILSKGLKARLQLRKAKINILACENLENNSGVLRKKVLALGEIKENDLESIAAFPDTEVDRLVLKSERNGEPAIDIGDEFELVVDKTKLVNPGVEPIKNAFYTTDIHKYFERKLFIINTGHFWAGYVGHVYGYKVIQDVFANKPLLRATREAMKESAVLIEKKYGFSKDDLDDYISFALNRFMTPGVVDQIARVSRNPIQKIGPQERLVQPVQQLADRNLPYQQLVKGISAALLFDLDTDQQAIELQHYIEKNGVKQTIVHFTGIAEESVLFSQIMEHYNRFKQIKEKRTN